MAQILPSSLSLLLSAILPPDTATSAWATAFVPLADVIQSASCWQLSASLCSLLLLLLLYNWLDLHLLSHLLFGDTIQTFHHPHATWAQAILQQMKISRFWPTFWLCSPHLQTTFLHFLSRSPAVLLQRELLTTPDGGTLALDWSEPADGQAAEQTRARDSTPIVIIVPGLTSDSNSQYIRHCVAEVVARGFRVLVANHRGLGGVKITSRLFYNAGWTTDLRFILSTVSARHPSAPLLAIGASLGANILVKYLGEEGSTTPLKAAAAVGCPWDLVICDRFMSRASHQRFYNSAMAMALKTFAHEHKDVFSQLVNWTHLFGARSIREFDDRITRVVGNYETVDTYYRRCSSAPYLPSVAIPLFCLSALDDPICTKEAIPFDEARSNENVILAVSHHGGHLAYLTGLTASRIWWVRETVHFLKLIVEPPTLSPAAASPPSLHLKPAATPFLTASRSMRCLAPTAAADAAQLEAVSEMEEEGDERDEEEAEEEDEGVALALEREARGGEAASCKGRGRAGEFVDVATGSGGGSMVVMSGDAANGIEGRGGIMVVRYSSEAELIAMEDVLLQLLQQVQSRLQEGVAQLQMSASGPSRSRVSSSPSTSHAMQSASTSKMEILLKSWDTLESVKHTLDEKLKDMVVREANTRWLMAYVAIAATFPLVATAIKWRLHNSKSWHLK